jgi:hypothetical protein
MKLVLLSLQSFFGPFVGALAKQLHKANVNHAVTFVHPSVLPPAHMERREFHWMDLR